MKEETKMKDRIHFARKSSFEPIEIPMKEVPPSKIFDIRLYKGREWVLIFMDRETFDCLRALCEKRGLDIKKVMYGAIMHTKELLNSK